MQKIESTFQKIKNQIKSQSQEEEFLQYLNIFYSNIEEQNEKSNIIENYCFIFFEEYNIFYNKTSKIYYLNNNNNIILKNEDNILHIILEFISKQKDTINTNTKNLIKNKIIKQIKENNINEIIPESETIQFILNSLSPNIFLKKEYSKLFLFIIGNIILKKKNEYIFFIRSSMKPFFNEINKYISTYFCNHNILNYFKFKYTNDHKNNKKILLYSNNIHYNIFNFNEQYYINLICVSIYYSNRFNNIEEYIEHNDLQDCIHYFNENNLQNIIKSYIHKYISNENNQEIYEKDLIFLWKKYIHENDISILPFINYNEFINHLFIQLNQKYYPNNTNNILKGYYSFETPGINHFKQFWIENFEYDNNEKYFEINEILFLYNKINKQKKININETTISLILQSYYSQYEIINDKFIHNVKCKLWNKKNEIDTFISNNNLINNSFKNINYIYKLYSKNDNNLKISKRYFEFYIKKNN